MGIDLLFIGNDWDVLDEMQRALRSRRAEWNMTFSCGAVDAKRQLARAENSPTAVICQDVLPSMDGFEFLRTMKVKKDRDPIRLIVTSNPRVELVSGSIPWVHGCVGAPLSASELDGRLAEFTADPGAGRSMSIRALTDDLDRLPSLPATYQKVVEITNKLDFSLREVSEVIQEDVGLTAETLRMVNSSFFGLRGEIGSVEQAVNLLGLDMVRGLVLANSLFEEQDSTSLMDLALVSDRSQKIASIARVVAEIDGLGKSEQALSFLAGMLHLVGVLLFPASGRRPGDDTFLEQPDLAADVSRFGVDRYAIGTYLLRMWEFEQTIVEAVAALGRPDLATTPIAMSLLHAVRLLDIEGFPTPRFVEGDVEVREKVAAIRAQWAATATPLAA